MDRDMPCHHGEKVNMHDGSNVVEIKRLNRGARQAARVEAATKMIDLIEQMRAVAKTAQAVALLAPDTEEADFFADLAALAATDSAEVRRKLDATTIRIGEARDAERERRDDEALQHLVSEALRVASNGREARLGNAYQVPGDGRYETGVGPPFGRRS
jgi:hypothetical protein